MTRARAAALVLAACAVACAHDPGPGRVAPDEPLQEDAPDAAPIRRDDYELTPLASYDIEARVLSTETYRFDREADLCTLDLALGWGPMSDGEILRHFEIEQAFRWFTWKTPDFPIPREDVEAHAANVHVIPSDAVVARRLKGLRRGDVVRLRGLLVEARAEDGWSWRSSLSRTDTGSGACELLYVEDIGTR